MSEKKSTKSTLKGDRTKFTSKKTDAQKRYLKRQSKDPYTKRAQAEGYRSRAAYKLIEIDEKFNLLKNAKLVVDLGAAPGGWCQVVLERNPQAHILALDLLPMDPMEQVHSIKGDFTTDEIWQDVQTYMAQQGRADVVLSDMAQNTTGHASTDHLRIMNLAETAAEAALNLLKPGGHFITKLFQGGQEQTLRNHLRPHFQQVKFHKPASSRADSREQFLIALNFKN